MNCLILTHGLFESLQKSKSIYKNATPDGRVFGFSRGIDRLCPWDNEIILSMPTIAGLLDGKEQLRVIDAV